jgi:hypothetical protein
MIADYDEYVNAMTLWEKYAIQDRMYCSLLRDGYRLFRQPNSSPDSVLLLVTTYLFLRVNDMHEDMQNQQLLTSCYIAFREQQHNE